MVQIEQVKPAKLLGVCIAPTNPMLTRVNYIIDIMSQRLYLLNQLRKLGLDIKCLTELFVGLVIARFRYVLSAFAGQLNIYENNRIDVIFAKGFKWRLTTKVFTADDIIKHSDEQLFRAILKSNHCLFGMLPL